MDSAMLPILAGVVAAWRHGLLVELVVCLDDICHIRCALQLVEAVLLGSR